MIVTVCLKRFLEIYSKVLMAALPRFPYCDRVASSSHLIFAISTKQPAANYIDTIHFSKILDDPQFFSVQTLILTLILIQTLIKL